MLSKTRCKYDWADLKALYVNEKLSMKEIALKKGCCVASVQHAKKVLNIPSRPYDEATLLRYAKNPRYNWDDLYNLYIQQQLSTTEIAKIKGCSHRIVRVALKKAGIPIRTSKEGVNLLVERYGHFNPESPWFKGGRAIDTQGYVWVPCPDHPRADKKGYVREHILVWEAVHQRPLPDGYIIHHLNGIKDDNRPENLMAMKPFQHANLALPYKKRIRELEAKVKLLERALDSQQLVWWSEN